jgi:hypothetical protein
VDTQASGMLSVLFENTVGSSARMLLVPGLESFVGSS